MSEPSDPGFESLLSYIKGARGVDLSGYKRTSLMRRVRKRMQAVPIESFVEYLDYLQVHPDEFTSLFNGLLINVTGFYRDPPFWEYVAQEIVPLVLSTRGQGQPIRAWVAGCSSGQEAYTLAMILADSLGNDEFQDRVKIYATDIDEEALAQARQAIYDPRDVSAIPKAQRERYFEPLNGAYAFRKELRRSVIFGRHDLLQDAPISRIDLLSCRNTLMYFNSEAQTRILSRFHFALNDTGYLLLGKSEMLLTHGRLFTPVNLRRRVFAKVRSPGLRDRLMVDLPDAGMEEQGEASGHLLHRPQLAEAAQEVAPTAQVILDHEGRLCLANERARELLGLKAEDLGQPLHQVSALARPFDLVPRIEQALAERRCIVVSALEWPSPGGRHLLDIEIRPLGNTQGASTAVSVAFTDVTPVAKLEEALRLSRHDLERTQEELQSAVEELETTNEELQSTNEELETTNEELQSTNEELETVNEELQSTNEELEAINEELQHRSTELSELNGFLEAILASQRSAMVVVDRDLRVQAWNRRSEDLWGLRADEVRGQHLLNLDIGLPVEKLALPVRACLTDADKGHGVSLRARDRRGRDIYCRVVCTRLTGQSGDGQGVVLWMDEDREEHPDE